MINPMGTPKDDDRRYRHSCNGCPVHMGIGMCYKNEPNFMTEGYKKCYDLFERKKRGEFDEIIASLLKSVPIK